MHHSKDCPIIISRDFNCRVGHMNEIPEELVEGTSLDYFRNSLDSVINSRGRDLVEFMEQHSMVLLNGRLPSDMEGSFSFVSHLGNSTPDLIWCNSQYLDIVFDLNITCKISMSDHFSLILSCKLPVQNTRNFKQRNVLPLATLNWNPNLEFIYKNMMQSSSTVSANFTNMDIDSLFKNFHQTVNTVSTNLNMRRYNTSKNNLLSLNNKPWFDVHCKNKKKEVEKLLKNCVKHKFDKISKAS